MMDEFIVRLFHIPHESQCVCVNLTHVQSYFIQHLYVLMCTEILHKLDNQWEI